MCSGCGRIGFDATADGAVDDVVDGDGTGDGNVEQPRLCGFAAWRLSPPALMDDANGLLVAQNPAIGDQDEFDPAFSESGLELYVTSDQGGSFDVWILRRSAVDAAFTTVVAAPSTVNGPGGQQEFGYQPLASRDVAFISANYNASASMEYWIGRDLSTGPLWTESALSTPGNDIDGRMTSTGLELYFVRTLGADDSTRDIFRATRADVGSDFSNPTAVDSLNTQHSDASPIPVAGGMLFASQRPGGKGSDDIWYAPFQQDSAELGTAIALEPLNSDVFDGEPALFATPGRCEIVFVSNRAGPFNLYRSFVEPL